MHVFGVSSLFGVGDTPDKKNSEWSIVGVAQGGVALPDRDYYLSADPDRVALRAKYVAHVAKMLTLVGGEYEDAAIAEVRSPSHWSPYDRVGVVNADP
jgi:predicted metalloendopeptidase